jgi:hypothetical protein
LEALETRLVSTINVTDPRLLVRETTAVHDAPATAQDLTALPEVRALIDARLCNTPKESWLTVVGTMAPGINATPSPRRGSEGKADKDSPEAGANAPASSEGSSSVTDLRSQKT